MTWTPLHLHSEYSLLDSTNKSEQIIKRCQDLGYKSSAITDHGSLSGCVKFFNSCKKGNIKPILGIEFYISSQDASIHDKDNRHHEHIVLLAKNKQGWQDLLKITSIANTESNFYYKPRLSLKQIGETVSGGNIISLTGHLGSTLTHSFYKEGVDGPLNENFKTDIVENINFHYDIFGKENVFIEIQLIDIDNKKVQEVGTILREICNLEGFKTVSTADSHYISKESVRDHRVVLATNLKKSLRKIYSMGDKKPLLGFFETENYHIPSIDELKLVNSESEIKASLEISDICEEYDIFRQPELPKLNKNNGELEHLCKQGWDRLNIDEKINLHVYEDRLKHELDVLNSCGLSDYFLIVEDYVRWAKSNNIMVGCGRGSGGGCLVNYLLNVTTIDPIQYDLIFERFYNVGRNSPGNISLPDIDIDFEVRKRDEIISYIKNKYGSDKVAQISTFGTLKGKACLKDILRAWDIPFKVMNLIADEIEEEQKIADELAEDKSYNHSTILWTLRNKPNKLKRWAYIDTTTNDIVGEYSEYFKQALRLEHTVRNRGRHAAGIVIANKPLYEYCPMIWDATLKSQICGFDMGDLEKVSLVKFDILGTAVLDKTKTCVEILSNDGFNIN